MKLTQLIARVVCTSFSVYIAIKLLINPNEDLNEAISNVFKFVSDGNDFLIIGISLIVGYIHNELMRKVYIKLAWDRVAERIIKFIYSVKNPSHTYNGYDHKAMQVFYKAVDTSESLKSKSNIVMLNGILITAVCDFVIYSFLHMMAQCLIALFESHFVANERIELGLKFCVLGTFPAILLAIFLIRRHERLAQDQIDFIVANNVPL